MNVIRLVVLGILFYVAWLLVKGIFDIKRKRGADSKESSAGSEAKVEDVLVEDPVCHTLVPKHQAIRLRKNKETYYFCSDACCDKFSESTREEK